MSLRDFRHALETFIAKSVGLPVARAARCPITRPQMSASQTGRSSTTAGLTMPRLHDLLFITPPWRHGTWNKGSGKGVANRSFFQRCGAGSLSCIEALVLEKVTEPSCELDHHC